ncbi:hypothetical protein ACN20G_17655 [Streptomyces sp. BI20]|uniref:hypothetical protein n=1 Tax=Streptomyces sp. BI20 TaxID=3403460 RepID=UPI003C736D57
MGIKQAYVQADDKPSPALKDVRDRIATAVAATTGATGLKRLAYWLQVPETSEFKKMLDSNCHGRAEAIGGVLSSGEAGGLLTPADLGSVSSPAVTWAAIDTGLKAGRAVYVKGPAGHVGGGVSRFAIGFHVIVFLAVGKESDGTVYYLGLDPDVSATTESRDAWKALVKAPVEGGAEVKPAEFTVEAGLAAVKTLILGDGDSGFGPLVRKYYVDTTAKFPRTQRIPD